MTIAIAPIMAKLPAQGASANSISPDDTPSAGADFSSLLLGQLSAGAELQQVPIDNSATSAAAAASDLLDTSTSPQDAAMLLAALGMAAPQQNTKISTDDTGADADTLLIANDKKTPGILLTSVSADPKAALPAAALETDAKTRTELPVASATNDKAAKFAVPGMDSPAIKNTVPDSDMTQASTTVLLPPSQTGNTTPIPGTSLRVDTPVRDASWPGDFAQKVVWLTSNEQKFAQLTLNPPQMGPIEISLNINKESASAYFMSPNAEVRAAIETALPRLREMLADVGIQLGQANVSAQSSHQEAGKQNTPEWAPRWIADKDILGIDSKLNQAIIAQRGNGLVDTFA